ncbi:hypothetical protein TSMEX_007438 [Taenia solium]|eukprot:TsM_000657600 transcript=TsM_000657600 gene=TsM_000657600
MRPGTFRQGMHECKRIDMYDYILVLLTSLLIWSLESYNHNIRSSHAPYPSRC